MKINFIDYLSACGNALSAIIQHPKTSIKTDCSIYILPPNMEIKKFFNYNLTNAIKTAFDPTAVNFVVRSCFPCDNWRLKHVGKKFHGAIYASDIRVHKEFELGNGWIDFIDELHGKMVYSKFSVECADIDDIRTIVSGMHEVSVKYSTNNIVFDANTAIDHTSAMPEYVSKMIASAMTDKIMV